MCDFYSVRDLRQNTGSKKSDFFLLLLFFQFSFQFSKRYVRFSTPCVRVSRLFLSLSLSLSHSLSSLVFRREEDRVAGEMLGGREVALAGECCPCDTSTNSSSKHENRKANFLSHKGHSIVPVKNCVEENVCSYSARVDCGANCFKQPLFFSSSLLLFDPWIRSDSFLRLCHHTAA